MTLHSGNMILGRNNILFLFLLLSPVFKVSQSAKTNCIGNVRIKLRMWTQHTERCEKFATLKFTTWEPFQYNESVPLKRFTPYIIVPRGSILSGNNSDSDYSCLREATWSGNVYFTYKLSKRNPISENMKSNKLQPLSLIRFYSVQWKLEDDVFDFIDPKPPSTGFNFEETLAVVQQGMSQEFCYVKESSSELVCMQVEQPEFPNLSSSSCMLPGGETCLPALPQFCRRRCKKTVCPA